MSSNNSSNSGDNTSETSSNKKELEFTIVRDPKAYFSQKELCHYKNIDKFFRECYKNKSNELTDMIDIIEGNSKISLRILDWYVTKYSKKRISYGANNKNNEIFDVRISYKAQLKAYKKRYFDPFRRRDKFTYPCDNDGFELKNEKKKYIVTTLGQLNFFRWAFTNNIISHVSLNYDQITQEMVNFNKEKKKVSTKTEEEEKIKININEQKIRDINRFVLNFD